MKQKNKRIDFITGGTESEDNYVDADFLNQAQEELENVVRASGFAFDENNEQQVAQAITDHALGASYAEDTGTANNYILSITGSRQTPPVLVKGYRLFFQTGNVNTSTTPTLNYAGLGVKTIVAENGTDAIVAGDIKVGAYNEVVYDGTNWRLILSKVNSASETVAGKIKISTTAQTAAGVDDTAAVTPFKLKQYTGSITGNSKTSNGWTYLGNGLILQWGGTGSIPSGSSATVTLPTPFPNSGLRAFACVAGGGGNIIAQYYVIVESPSTTQLIIRNTCPAAVSIIWFAIGY